VAGSLHSRKIPQTCPPVSATEWMKQIALNLPSRSRMRPGDDYLDTTV
jgi:hypothetical protein